MFYASIAKIVLWIGNYITSYQYTKSDVLACYTILIGYSFEHSLCSLYSVIEKKHAKTVLSMVCGIPQL